MMEQKVVDEFGRAVVELVRDPVVAEAGRTVEQRLAEGAAVSGEWLVDQARMIVDLVVARWVDAAQRSAFPVRVLRGDAWVDVAQDAGAAEPFRVALRSPAGDEALRAYAPASGSRPPVEGMERRWWDCFHTEDGPMFASVVVPDVVDTALPSVLDALDDDSLRLEFHASGGDWVDMSFSGGCGELLGWYFGEDGWLDRFATEHVGGL